MGFLSKVWKGVKKTLVSPLTKLFDWLIPEAESPQALEVKREGSNNPLPIVYGTRLVGGVVVHKYVTDSVTGVSGSGIDDVTRKNAYLHLIVAFCHGEIDDIESFYFDGELAPSGEFRQNTFFIAYTKGTDDGEALPSAVANIPNFDASMMGKNVCYAHIILYQDKNFKNFRGEPEIQAVIRGRKVYDPRNDTTAYSENNALCTLDLLTNPIYGRGLSLDDIEVQTFVDGANFCDESTSSEVTKTIYQSVGARIPPVPITVTETVTTPRYRMNAVLNTDSTVFDNYKLMLQSFRAYPRRPNGKPAIGVEDVGTAVMTFDSAKGEVYNDIGFTIGGLRDRYNSFTVVFPNEFDRYERDEATFPATDSQLYQDWLDEDNGKELSGRLEINTLSDKSSAIQTAEIAAKRSRVSGRLSIEVGAKARWLEPGDIIAISDESYGWTEKEFRVTQIRGTEQNTFNLDLREHQNSVYPWSGAEFEEIQGGSWLGNPFEPEPPTNLVLTQDPTLATTGTLRWDGVDDSFVREYNILLEKNESGEWVEIKNDRTRGTRYEVSLLDIGSYRISVRSVTTLGLSSGPALLSFTLAIPVPPSSINLTHSDWQIEVRPQLAGAGLGTEFEFDVVSGDGTGHTPIARAKASAYTASGLIPDTLYTVFVRTVNAYGVSAWVSESATTTFTGEQVDPYLNTIRDELDGLDLRFDDLDLDIININDDITLITDEISDIDTRLTASDFKFNELQRNAEDLEVEFLRSFTETAASREELRRRQENGELLIDAAVFVDPSTGTIVNRAFSYTDDAFNSASLRIDGVEGSVTLLSQQQSLLEGELEDLSAELSLVPGQITATATAVVSEAISALEPAAVFNFFDSAQGWVAVNGTLSTATPNEINLTLGDIENNSLNFVAEGNPIIRLSISRTGGTGWVGDLVFERDDNTTQTLSGIIEDIPMGGAISRNIDLRDVTSWNGTINRIRLVLGQSVADEFTVSQITIGAPNADQLALDDLTVRVTQAELDINANEGQINLVSSNLEQFEGDVEDSFSTANIRIDSVENEIESRVFQIVGNRVDFEEQAIEDLRELVNQSDYRSADISEKISYADAINKLNIDVGPEGALAESITALEAATVTIDSQVSANAQQILTVETNFTNALAQSEQTLNARINTADSNIAANATEITRVETDANSAISALESTLQAQINTNEGNISANASEIVRVETKADSAISTLQTSLQAQINANDSDISANAVEITRVETSAASARAVLQNNLQAQINTNEGDITAAFNEIGRVETDASSARATLQSTLQANINGVNSELQSTITRVDSVEVINGQQATAINGVQGKVDDPINNNSALFGFVQTAQTTADGAVTSVSQLTNRVENNEVFAAAQLQLNSEINSELGTLSARAFLGTNVNNRITGVIIDDDGIERVIEFAADSVRFIDGAGNAKIFYDLANNRYVFDGEINATAGTFTGTVSGATIQGGVINGATGNFSGTVTASNIVGDTAVGAVTNLTTIIVNSSNPGPLKVVEFTINSQSYARDVMIELPYAQSLNDGVFCRGLFRIEKNGQLESSQEVSGNYSLNGAPFVFTLKENESATFKIEVSHTAGGDLVVFGRGYGVSVFRKSEQITFL